MSVDELCNKSFAADESNHNFVYIVTSATTCCHYKHLLEQLMLQLQVSGKQYSINDPVMQSSCGTVPKKLFEYKDMPESATQTEIVVSHPIQKEGKAWMKVNMIAVT